MKLKQFVKEFSAHWKTQYYIFLFKDDIRNNEFLPKDINLFIKLFPCYSGNFILVRKKTNQDQVTYKDIYLNKQYLNFIYYESGKELWERWKKFKRVRNKLKVFV